MQHARVRNSWLCAYTNGCSNSPAILTCSAGTLRGIYRQLQSQMHAWGSIDTWLPAVQQAAALYANSLEDAKLLPVPTRGHLQVLQTCSWPWTMARPSSATARSCPCTRLCFATCLRTWAPASMSNERVTLPLADFTEAQCSALLAHLYNHGTTTKGPTFEEHNTADLAAAVAVARFARTYDASHALRHVEAYLVAFMHERFQHADLCAGMT